MSDAIFVAEHLFTSGMEIVFNLHDS